MAGDFLVACPNCRKHLRAKAEYEGKRIKCTCGETFTARPDPALAPAPIAYRSADQTGAVSEHSALVRQTIILGSVLALLVGLVFGLRFLAKSPSANKQVALGDDAQAERMISDEGGMEVRRWIKARPGRLLGGMTNTQAEARIEEWYGMGAKTVYAFGGVMSLHVVIELPADAGQRQKLVDWVNHYQGGSFDPRVRVKDVGQKYLVVRLRL